jgi:hypothetical protein
MWSSPSSASSSAFSTLESARSDRRQDTVLAHDKRIRENGADHDGIDATAALDADRGVDVLNEVVARAAVQFGLRLRTGGLVGQADKARTTNSSFPSSPSSRSVAIV